MAQEALYLVEVQHSSDRKRDGVWHPLEASDNLKYIRDRAGNTIPQRAEASNG